MGCIDPEVVADLFHEYPQLKEHMLNEIVDNYDDDLKLFLVSALRRVDYLSKVSKEIIVNLAYVCTPEIIEKGASLYRMDEDIDDQIKDEIIIVFSGCIELYFTMDTGTEMCIEHLGTGSILNPHNMLSRRKHSINARAMTNTTFYYLKY